jgi:hypothetical protein
MTATASSPVRSNESVSMTLTVQRGLRGVQSLRRLGAFQRLGLKWGCKPDTAKDQVYGERGIYQKVADANEAFLADGLAERVAMLMAVVDASMLTEVPHWSEAIHRHNTADAHEDVAQAEWIKNTSDDALEGYIKKLAGDLRAGEVLLAALVQERNARRAK